MRIHSHVQGSAFLQMGLLVFEYVALSHHLTEKYLRQLSQQYRNVHSRCFVMYERTIRQSHMQYYRAEYFYQYECSCSLAIYPLSETKFDAKFLKEAKMLIFACFLKNHKGIETPKIHFIPKNQNSVVRKPSS